MFTIISTLIRFFFIDQEKKVSLSTPSNLQQKENRAVMSGTVRLQRKIIKMNRVQEIGIHQIIPSDKLIMVGYQYLIFQQ